MKIPNMRLYLVRLNIFALLVCGAFYIHGFTIQPISQSFQPSGPESSQVFLLQNPGERTVAVELRMLTRELQPDGSEVRNPADNEFSIFPQRVILEPDERRTIRVRWLGRENPEIELSYRLLAEQLPVDFDEQDSSDGGVINLMFRYLAAVYITPEGAEPEIRISLDEEPRGDGTEIPDKPVVWLRMDNTGSRHRILSGLEILLRLENGEELRLGPESLEGLANHNLTAGSSRLYRVSLPAMTSGVQDVDFRLSD